MSECTAMSVRFRNALVIVRDVGVDIQGQTEEFMAAWNMQLIQGTQPYSESRIREHNNIVMLSSMIFMHSE